MQAPRRSAGVLRPTRRASLVIALAALLAAPAHAAAPMSAGSVFLTWRAPVDRCPAQAELQGRVDRLLDGAAVGLMADASVFAPTVDEPRWRLDLQIRWARGHDDRSLFASECVALADATVVLVAVLAAPLALTDNFTASTLPPAPVFVPPPVTSVPLAPSITSDATAASSAPLASSASSAPLASSDDALERPAPPPDAPPLRFSRRRGPFARVAAVAGYGVLPRFDLGVQIAAGSLLPRLRVEGALTLLPPQAAELGDGSNRGAVPGFASAAVRVCPRFLGAPLELSLCAAVEGGVSWSRSLGLTPETRAAGPWLAFALGPALDWWFSPQVALHAGVEAVAAPVATAYSLGDQNVAGGRHFGVRGAFGLTFAITQQKPGRAEK